MTTEQDSPRPRVSVLDIDPYVPGQSQSGATPTRHKLSSNETPIGPSPKAIDAYRSAAGMLSRYPDGGARLLREAIGTKHGIDPARIVCGTGSGDILNLLSQAFLNPGDEAIHSAHGFLVYKIATMAAGGLPVLASESNLTTDVDAILAAVSPRTRIIFLANPNNPTGTYLAENEIARLHRNLPADVLLVLDAAYAEYVRRNDYEPGLDLTARAKNVVMTRTFSKVYGLASLRIGWCTGPAHIIDAINRIRGPFNVSGPALAAGAAALTDLTHLEIAIDHNAIWLPRVTAAIDELGLTVTPSVANFVLIHFLDEPGRTSAEADSFLLSRGIVLRRMEAYGLPGALRMTIGSEMANNDTVRAIAEFLDGGGPK